MKLGIPAIILLVLVGGVSSGCVDGSLANRDDGSNAAVEERQAKEGIDRSSFIASRTQAYKNAGASNAAAAATAATDYNVLRAAGNH